MISKLVVRDQTAEILAAPAEQIPRICQFCGSVLGLRFAIVVKIWNGGRGELYESLVLRYG